MGSVEYEDTIKYCFSKVASLSKWEFGLAAPYSPP